MRGNMTRGAAGLGAVGLLALVTQAGAADPQGADLKTVLKDEHARDAGHWIYNDLKAGFSEAEKTGRPLLVTFRCVPCKACGAFDGEVAQGSEIIKKLVAEHFVAVRQVEMKGVDLSQFQFDHDLNWAAMFLNADGTVYGRYGTQSERGPDAYNSIKGLSTALKRVLELHEAYPGNAKGFAGKKGLPKPYATAMEMPGLERKVRLRGPTQRNNCIHCHNIHDAEHAHAIKTGAFRLDMLWRYPLPENIGLQIDPDDGRTVKSVQPDSPAAKAGLRAKDELTHAGGQIIISIADIQWVLHGLPNTQASVALTIRRGDEKLDTIVTLPAGWKKTDISWRGSMWALPPSPGLWLKELASAEKQRRGIGRDELALEIRGLFKPKIRASGLKERDVIVAYDGERGSVSPGKFHAYLRLNHHRPGSELDLELLRGDQRVKLKVKF